MNESSLLGNMLRRSAQYEEERRRSLFTTTTPFSMASEQQRRRSSPTPPKEECRRRPFTTNKKPPPTPKEPRIPTIPKVTNEESSMASAEERAARTVQVEKEFCPKAILDWFYYEHKEGKGANAESVDIILSAKKHLSYMGWVFWYGIKGQKQQRKELRYTSPSGVSYYSLRAACKACIEGGVRGAAVDGDGSSMLGKRERDCGGSY